MKMITEEGIDFNEFEQWCFDEGMAYARELMKQTLLQIDIDLLLNRDMFMYRAKGFRNLNIKTLMGDVSIERRIYQCNPGTGKTGHVYLLDQVINLETVGEVSMNLALRMAEEITEKSYRGTSRSISSMTGQNISHGGVWNTIQSLGEKINGIDKNRAKAAKNFTYTGDRSIPALMEEYDGIWINMQGKDRPKKGSKAEMKIAVSYEGTNTIGYDKEDNAQKSRINPLYMAGFESTSEFFEKKEGQLATVYNLDEITERLVNGDGGKWIKICEEKTGGNTYFQLDPFHIKKSIKKTGLCAEMQHVLNRLLELHKVEEALNYADYLVKTEPDKDKHKKLLEMYEYLNNHKDYLIPINERGIDELKDYENILNSKMGSAETTVCSIAALRMKHRRASFTKRGATNLARLLTLDKSDLLGKTISNLSTMILPITYDEVVTETLTAAKSPKYDGNGYNYPYKGGTPFDGQFTTNGRQAVRKMLSNRRYSELVYR